MRVMEGSMKHIEKNPIAVVNNPKDPRGTSKSDIRCLSIVRTSSIVRLPCMIIIVRKKTSVDQSGTIFIRVSSSSTSSAVINLHCFSSDEFSDWSVFMNTAFKNLQKRKKKHYTVICLFIYYDLKLINFIMFTLMVLLGHILKKKTGFFFFNNWT